MRFVRHGEFYDLSVPGWEHYSAEGLWHHNSGKSFVLCYNRIKSLQPRGLYMVLAPTYKLLADATQRTFLDLCRQIRVPVEWGRSDHRAFFPRTGAEVLFRSADNPENLRGPNLAGVDMDEASLMTREVYDIAIGRLRSDGRMGTLRAAFTPKGPTHWTHEVFASGKPDTAMIRARTDENPFNPPEFAATIAHQYGETNWARQELGGEFVQLEGAEFEASWLTGDDLWFDAWPPDLQLKVIALDPSKGADGHGKDYQAIVLIGVAIEGGRYVYYVDADLQREGVTQMCDRVVQHCRLFDAAGGRRVDSVVCEENSTLGLLKPAMDAACVKANYPIPYILRTNTDRKEFRVRLQLAPPLSRRQLRFRRTPGGRMLVGQAQSFPFDEHDDGIDALATGLRRVAELLSGGG